MKIFYYSAKNNGIYAHDDKDVFLSQGTWPNDALQLSNEQFVEFCSAPHPEGKMLAPGAEGYPTWADIPPPTRDELIVAAELEKQGLINVAMQSVSVLQLKLQAGRKLSAVEKSRLNAVLDYIDVVNDVDTSKAPDVDWPEQPKLA